jgi:hypothetical protein
VLHEKGAAQGGAVAIGVPGSGGVSRGRGDAELTFGAETPGRFADFEATLLPRAERRDLESSELEGIGAASPKPDAVGESAGIVEVEGSLGRSSFRRRLAPRHRDAVSRFFTSEAPSSQGE